MIRSHSQWKPLHSQNLFQRNKSKVLDKERWDLIRSGGFKFAISSHTYDRLIKRDLQRCKAETNWPIFEQICLVKNYCNPLCHYQVVLKYQESTLVLMVLMLLKLTQSKEKCPLVFYTTHTDLFLQEQPDLQPRPKTNTWFHK